MKIWGCFPWSLGIKFWINKKEEEGDLVSFYIESEEGNLVFLCFLGEIWNDVCKESSKSLSNKTNTSTSSKQKQRI